MNSFTYSIINSFVSISMLFSSIINNYYYLSFWLILNIINHNYTSHSYQIHYLFILIFSLSPFLLKIPFSTKTVQSSHTIILIIQNIDCTHDTTCITPQQPIKSPFHSCWEILSINFFPYFLSLFLSLVCFFSMTERKQLAIRNYEVIDDINLNEVRLIQVPHLKDHVKFTEDSENKIENIRKLAGPRMHQLISPFSNHSLTLFFIDVLYNDYQTDHSCILADIVRKPSIFPLLSPFYSLDDKPYITAYVRGGPRPYLWFDSSKVNAVIVTCGGLCPGLNNVIREITSSLYISLISVHWG